MFKKFISALIIFSLFYTDVANAIHSESAFFHDDMNVTVKSHPSLPPHTQPPRRVKSSESFNSFQESPPKVFSSPKLALPIGVNHSNKSLLTGSPVSSSLDSQKKSDDESHNEKFSKDLSDGSPTGSLNNEALSQVSSEQNSPPSLQDFPLVIVGEKKPEVLLTSVVGNANLPVVSKKQLESDQEGETHVNPRGSIQELDIHSGSFTCPNKRGSVLDAFLSSSENKKKAPPTERTSLLQQSASRPATQELKPTRDEKKDARELVVVVVVSRTKEENPSVQNVDDLLPLLANQLEEGRRSDFQSLITKVKRLKPDGDDTDKRVMAFLTYAKQHIVDGKFTWRQGLGGLGGVLIGIGVGNAMPPIFSGGIVQISSEATWNNTEANLFIAHTAITLGVDSISRNVMIIGDLVGPSTEEFSIPGIKLTHGKINIDPRKGALLLVYTGAGFDALLPVFYLWSVAEDHIKYDKQYNAGKNIDQYLALFWCLAPTLWLDSLFTNGRAAKEWVDEKFNNLAVHRAFSNRLSPESSLRQQELKRFKELERFFKYVSDEDIDDLYEQVLVNGFKIKKNGINIPEDTVKSGDALRNLKVLRNIHAGAQLPKKVKETWKHIVSEICEWGIPIAATVGRSLVFYTIIYHLLGDLGLSNEGAKEAAKFILSGIFGGIIASFFQGKVEKDSIKTGVYELLNGEDTEGDASHSRIRSGVRKVGKGYNYLQGAWNTFPYILIGLVATSGWPVALQVATLLFFGVADMFNNTMSFHESYGGAIGGAESLLSYGYATTSYKRNKLIRLTRRYRLAYETMAPNVMMKVDALLSGEESNELLNDY